MTTGHRRIVDELMFPEGLRWHDGALWFSDFLQRRVFSADESGGLVERAFIGAQPSGLGFTPDGAALVVGMYDRNLIRLGAAHPSIVANVGAVVEGPCNDMFVDARGGAYISNFGYEAMYRGMDPSITTCLAFVDADGTVRGEGYGLFMPNGVAGTADGRTLIVGETTKRRLTIFDVAADGALSNRRLFADLGERGPDGICIDASGAVWVATFDTGEVIRVREGGEVLDVVKVGGAWATACALGGADGRTLFCAVAETDIPSMQSGRARGWIEAVQVETPAW